MEDRPPPEVTDREPATEALGAPSAHRASLKGTGEASRPVFLPMRGNWGLIYPTTAEKHGRIVVTVPARPRSGRRFMDARSTGSASSENAQGVCTACGY